MSGATVVYKSPGSTVVVMRTTQGPPGASFATVTGTGFVHITAGALDPAARAVNVASADITGILPISSGGTGLSALGTSGQVLQVQAGALSYASVSLSTDLSGSLAAGGVLAATVLAIHGATVPIAGALTTGQVLQVTGASALGYAALNLGTAASITGALPVANVAHGTANQVLVTNSGGTATTWGSLSLASITPGTAGQILMSNATPATTWTTLSQDATISATGALTVTQAQDGAITFYGNGSIGGPLTGPGSTSLYFLGVNNLTAPSAALYLVPGSTTNVHSGGYAIFGDASGTFLSPGATSNNGIYFSAGRTSVPALQIQQVSTGWNIQLLPATSSGGGPEGSQYFGSGVGVLGINPAVTAPTGNPTTGGVIAYAGASTANAGKSSLFFKDDNGVVHDLSLVPSTAGTAGQLWIGQSATTLPAWTNVTGDTTITAGGVTTVGAVHGATVPIAGALTTGQVLQVTGASALGYAALNLATAASITGALPVANVAHGAAGQILTSNATPATAWQSLSGDGSLSGAAALTVTQIQAGAIVATVTTGALQWATTATPLLSQATLATTPVAFTIQAGNVTTGTGSNLVLQSGTGSVAAGNVVLAPGGVNGLVATPDQGGGIGVLAMGAVTTTPTSLPTSAVALWTTGTQQLATTAIALLFSNLITSGVNIVRQALASTSAAAGTNGAQLSLLGMQGQATTNAAAAGGNGGLLFAAGGAGGASATGQGGAGANTSFVSGAGGAATAGTGNGGASGNCIINVAAPGASAGGTVGALGKILLQLNGTTQASATSLGWAWSQSAVTFAASGTTTLTAAQQTTPSLKLSLVTLTGGATLALNGVTGTFYVDVSQVTLGAFSLTITNGAGSFTATTIAATKTLLAVKCDSTSTIAVG